MSSKMKALISFLSINAVSTRYGDRTENVMGKPSENAAGEYCNDRKDCRGTTFIRIITNEKFPENDVCHLIMNTYAE